MLEILEEKKERKITHSLMPPHKLFGYTAHALMIPPFCPQNILMLGYGQGTVDFLIDMIWRLPVNNEWQSIPKDAVDILDYPKVTGENTNYYKMDAFEFVKTTEKSYDYVIVDLYKGNDIPDFVFNEEFIKNLNRITNKILSVNCTGYKWNDFECYDKYFLVDCVKQVNEDKVLFFNPKKV